MVTSPASRAAGQSDPENQIKMKTTTKRIELDWTKLLGFNQVKSAKNQPDGKCSRAMIGAKVGNKVGSRTGGGGLG